MFMAPSCLPDTSGEEEERLLLHVRFLCEGNDCCLPPVSSLLLFFFDEKIKQEMLNVVFFMVHYGADGKVQLAGEICVFFQDRDDLRRSRILALVPCHTQYRKQHSCGVLGMPCKALMNGTNTLI
jgi:hypothetical protein